ncbi:MAG: pyruvate formate lyase-activating protein [Desulfarculus sp.]|nr:MAG: pyruvate formate lyase-activating protein [Desulfarculus sp.]
MGTTSLLACDIGGGTQDILLWRSAQNLENAVKLVLPAPTQVAAARLRRARGLGRDVFLHGWLMGGGAVHRAVDEHLQAGLKVFATPAAAATFADDSARVQAMGVSLCEQAPAGALPIPFGDLNLAELNSICSLFEVALPQTLALAVCDHGFSPGFSNRKFRFQQWTAFLERGGRLPDLLISDPPAHLTRLKALQEQAPGCLLMDTAAAAAWGALEDPAVAQAAQGPGVCIVNLGNMHTVAFIVRGGKVLGVYEHHTRCLDQATLADHVARFISGRLSDEEVFAGRGHGCARLPQAPQGLPGPPAVTGPQRRLAQGLGWPTAVPHGDVMLSGCFGLLAAVLQRGQDGAPRPPSAIS